MYVCAYLASLFPYGDIIINNGFTCKRGLLGQSKGLLIPRSSVRFRLKPDDSDSHGFELNRLSIKGTKLLLKVIKENIIIPCVSANDKVEYVKIKHCTCF